MKLDFEHFPISHTWTEKWENFYYVNSHSGMIGARYLDDAVNYSTCLGTFTVDGKIDSPSDLITISFLNVCGIRHFTIFQHFFPCDTHMRDR